MRDLVGLAVGSIAMIEDLKTIVMEEHSDWAFIQVCTVWYDKLSPHLFAGALVNCNLRHMVHRHEKIDTTDIAFRIGD